MESVRFHYIVNLNVLISGQELLLLARTSERHYDGVCRAAFRTYSGFGYGWVVRWLLDIDETCLDKIPSDVASASGMLGYATEFLDRKVEVEVSPNQLGTLLKICEMMPEGPDTGALIGSLFNHFHLLEAEYKRVNGGK